MIRPFYTSGSFNLPVVPVKGGFAVHVVPPSVHTFSAPRTVAPAPRVEAPVTTAPRTITVVPSTRLSTPSAPVTQTVIVHHDYAPYYHPAWYYPMWIHPWSYQTSVAPAGCYDASCGYYPQQSHWLFDTAIVVLLAIVAGVVWSRWR